MRFLYTCLVAAATCVPAALSQSPLAAPMPSCDGAVANIRVSQITPDGSMDKFMAAVAAQKAWYSSHGYPDRFFVSRVLVLDPGSKSYLYSDKSVMTYHLYSPTQPVPKQDAAFAAFVKLFSQTSTVTNTTLACVPKDMLGAVPK